MSRSTIVAIATVQSDAMAAAAGALAVVELMIKKDGRSNRRSPSRRFAIRESQFATADREAVDHDGWFRDQFCCTKNSFDRICEMIEEHWSDINGPIGFNACFFVRDRVALTMYYLMHSGSILDAAKQFGGISTYLSS